MRRHIGVVFVFAASLVLLAVAPAAKAAAAANNAGPKLEGSFKDWYVYSAGRGANRTCFAVSMPKEMTPTNVNRGKVSFLISSFPAQKKKNEPSIVAGYPYKPMSKATVQIGSDKFEFGLVSAEEAWMEGEMDEAKLLVAMKRGTTMSITGTSTRGTLTRDEYSLDGISAALEKLDTSCK
jgi:invasion protein IalB